MKSKRGILKSEILKILIAVVCILFLVYLGVTLFGFTMQKTEIEQARASLEQIVGVIDSLGEGEEKMHIVETREGESWLVYFGDVQGNELLCICLESNFREECVDEALGVCEQTEYVFEMLTPEGTDDTNIQYIKLNKLLVDVEIKRTGDSISITKSLVQVEGIWEEFSASKPEEACPNFVAGTKQGGFTEAYDVSEFNSIEEIIIDLPNYWEEIKSVNPYLFGQRTGGFLDGCAREFQQANEIFGMNIIFPELPLETEFVFHPISYGTPLRQWDREDYWETILMSEDGKQIIIKIYPEELFENER